MKNYFKSLSLFFIVCIFSFINSLKAQKDSNSALNDYLQGLTKASKSEKVVVDPTKVPTYDTKGNIVNTIEFVKLLNSGNYVLDKYVNDNSELKAMVLKPATEKEKKNLKIPLFRNVNKEFMGKQAPSFSVTDMDQNVFSLPNLKGKIVVLNFWFISCKPCIQEIPELNNLKSKYENMDAVFLGLALDEQEVLKTFLKKMNFTYNIIPGSKNIATDYGVNGYPTHVIIDKEGNIAYYATGLSNLTMKELNITLKKLVE